MNHIHVSAALARLARTTSPAVLERQQRPGARVLCRALMQRAGAVMGSFEARHLANVLWALAKLDMRPGGMRPSPRPFRLAAEDGSLWRSFDVVTIPAVTRCRCVVHPGCVHVHHLMENFP